MSPTTSAQVRRRQAARKQALARQQQLNEERRRRDEQELELAAEFAVLMEECAAARAAVEAAESAMGRVVDTMIGELRIRYHRAAQLLVTPEDELRRLRLVASDAAPAGGPPTTSERSRTIPSPPRRSTARGSEVASSGRAVDGSPEKETRTTESAPPADNGSSGRS